MYCKVEGEMDIKICEKNIFHILIEEGAFLTKASLEAAQNLIHKLEDKGLAFLIDIRNEYTSSTDVMANFSAFKNLEAVAILVKTLEDIERVEYIKSFPMRKGTHVPVEIFYEESNARTWLENKLL